MKKIKEKIVALCSVVAILASVFVAPCASAAEGTVDSISIRCLDQRASLNPTFEGWPITGAAYGGAMGKKVANADNTQIINASFKFNITQAGWYDATFIIASQSSTEYAAYNFSKINYWFDSETPAWLSDATINPTSPTVETLNKDPLNASGNYAQTKLLEPVYFGAGEHTINFETFANGRNDYAQVAFYSIDFDYADVSVIDIRCLDQRATLNPTFVGWPITGAAYGGAMGKNISNNNNAEKISARFDFNIKQEGWYDAKFIIASHSSTQYATGNYSKINYWFDSDTPKWLSDASINPESPTVTTLNNDPLNASGNYPETKLIEPVYFSAGDHTVYFETFEDSRNKSANVGFYSIRFENIDVSALNDITLHGGDYPSLAIEDTDGNVSYLAAETNRTNLQDGGKIAVLYKYGANANAGYETVNGFKFTIPFKVYEDGYYDCNIKMASCARLPISSNGWASPAYIGIDGEEPTWVKAFATATAPEITAKVVTSAYTSDTYDFQPSLWQELALKPMKLAAGNHTMTIHIPEQAPNQQVDLYVFALDSIHIRPVAAKTSFAAEGETLQLKDKSGLVEGSAFSDGSAVQYTNAGTVKVPFYLSSDGNYSLGAVAKGTAQYKIDGVEVSNIASIGDLSAALGSGWNRYKSGTSVQLNAGLHTLEIGVNDSYALDKIEILKPIDVTDIVLLGDDVVSIGQSGNLTVINQDGDEVSYYDVDSMCFQSSDENIITVDGYGKVTAVNYGSAVITVGVTVGNENMTTSKKINVAGEAGLFVEDATISGNDVTVKLSAVADAPASKVIVASYSVVDGVPTSLKAVDSADFGAISANASETKTITLSSIENSDRVCVFVFDSLDTIVPLYGKTIVR